jgi:hypothetical protein
MEAREMAYTLGWAIRLLRYYRAVPAAPRPPAQRQGRPVAPSTAAQPREARPEAALSPAPAHPTAPQLPTVGEVFTGKITQLDASAAVIEVPGFAPEKAIGLLSADVADLRRYRVGNAARVEVIELKTQRSGRVLALLKPAPRPKA